MLGKGENRWKYCKDRSLSGSAVAGYYSDKRHDIQIPWWSSKPGQRIPSWGLLLADPLRADLSGRPSSVFPKTANEPEPLFPDEFASPFEAASSWEE